MNEIELKFEITNRQIADLTLFLNQWVNCDAAEYLDSGQTQPRISQLTLLNTYYDTTDYYLRNNGCGLRVRVSEQGSNQHCEMTLKRDSQSIAGLHQRAEYNIDLPSPHLDITVLPKTALPKDCDINQLQNHLKPLFSTNFKRQAWLILFANSEIEVALDQGEIESNGTKLPIQEVELEIKQGNKQDLINFAIELARFNLHLFSQSKAARGYRLLKNQPINHSEINLSYQQSLPDILKFWQQNEEYALANNDLNFYQHTLQQVQQTLLEKGVLIEPEFNQWQHALQSIKSVSDFAYSEVNTKLKLMLLAQNNR
ncbi:hypothetical protein A9G09_10005 [Gilliamella sp. wkB292]|uniref:CYTH domain-containing protein n=1 Tax=Gilliamella sp. wkB292 TaxID=3120262 RepID=UPI00080E53E9|nr:CYTH domain-containing protein [Gilliamella apicola]OCG12274.1 hypothetical protein A9G09_10005 [Gilliamella apicola]